MNIDIEKLKIFVMDENWDEMEKLLVEHFIPEEPELDLTKDHVNIIAEQIAHQEIKQRVEQLTGLFEQIRQKEEIGNVSFK